jgi:hypothetical protein
MSKPQVDVTTNVNVKTDVDVKVSNSGAGGCAVVVAALLIGGALLLSGARGGAVTQTVNVQVDTFGQPITCPPTCGLYVDEPSPDAPVSEPDVILYPQTVEEIEANREAIISVVVVCVVGVAILGVGSLGLRRAQVQREVEARDWEAIDRGG